jgi:hypothetical protein
MKALLRLAKGLYQSFVAPSVPPNRTYPSSGLAEVHADAFFFLFGPRMTRLLFESVGLTLRFIGLGSLLCHVDSQLVDS